MWRWWVFVAAHSLSLVAVGGRRSLSPCMGAALQQLLLLHCAHSRHGLQELQHVGSGVVAHGFVALRHVGSSWTRDPTGVPCIAKWTLSHWATREAPEMISRIPSLLSYPLSYELQLPVPPALKGPGKVTICQRSLPLLFCFLHFFPQLPIAKT